jgi:hypothetical protein
MDDDPTCRAARRALAGDYLRLGADMILRRRLPEINDIEAGKIQEIDGHGDRGKGRILAFLTRTP